MLGDCRGTLLSLPNSGSPGTSAAQGWQPQPLPLWREFADPEGVPYYYNSKTGVRWELRSGGKCLCGGRPGGRADRHEV